ncbi:MAG TPA: hypothetical protein C5S51_02655 [Methanosarcinaceae archaeon]|nr:hypothetical protein [Methanosarcinaceae archaeon]
MQLANNKTQNDSRTESIEKIAKEASHNAVKNAFNHGRSVTIQQGEHIVKKYPDGSIEIIRKVQNSSVIPEKRQYHL